MGHLTHFGNKRPSAEVQRLVHALGNFVLAPSSSFDHGSYSQMQDILKQHHLKFLFLDERELPARSRLSEFHLGEVNTVDLAYVVQQARAVLLAFTNLSLLELQKYHQWSQATKTPLLIRPRQNDMLPGLVHQGKTGWILEEGENSFRQLFLENPTLRLGKRIDTESDQQLVDATVNELNRLYQKALTI